MCMCTSILLTLAAPWHVSQSLIFIWSFIVAHSEISQLELQHKVGEANGTFRLQKKIAAEKVSSDRV